MVHVQAPPEMDITPLMSSEQQRPPRALNESLGVRGGHYLPEIKAESGADVQH